MAQKKYPSEIIKIARKIVGLSNIYWDSDGYNRLEDLKEAEKDWLSALINLVCSFSFERMYAPRQVYPTIAQEVLIEKGATFKKPDSKFQRIVWSAFKTKAEKRGYQPQKSSNWNCLYNTDSGKISASKFAMKLADDDYNIIKWAQRKIEAQEASAAIDDLRTIRGFQYKLASFYLRDVARYYNLDELSPNDKWCFQPVDIWIRRFAQSWSSRAGLSFDANNWYDRSAEVFIEVAAQADVRAVDLNTGAWILGSEFSSGHVEGIAGSMDELKKCLRSNLNWNSLVSKTLSKII